METIGIALVALAVGLAAGVAIVALRGRGAGPSDLGRLEARLEVHAAELRRLADAAAVREGSGEALRQEVAAARRALEELNAREQERRAALAEDREVIRRLSAVLAGGAVKGRSGENVLRELLAGLPPGMLETDFRVNGKVVEFGLVLPDGRRLPVDSKWPAPAELEALERAEDPAEREALAREVERVVSRRAQEVAQYLDPALTAPVAVAAVPDAAYAACKRAHADAYARGVVIVPYGSALPILLFLYTLAARFGDAGDVRAALAEVEAVLRGIEEVIENKVQRASVMLSNAASELRAHVGRARGSLSRAEAEEEPPGGLRAVP
ncbi:MAG TPA: DNA recombination protein RmuC [Actinomycetota bacterium]|nr:DNA recombination protein RmuC [Actinomycetota bacterium]